MLAYCLFDPWEHVSVNLDQKHNSLHKSKWLQKCRLQKWRPFCLGFNVLRFNITENVWIVAKLCRYESSWDNVKYMNHTDYSRGTQNNVVHSAVNHQLIANKPYIYNHRFASTGDNIFLMAANLETFAARGDFITHALMLAILLPTCVHCSVHCLGLASTADTWDRIDLGESVPWIKYRERFSLFSTIKCFV